MAVHEVMMGQETIQDHSVVAQEISVHVPSESFGSDMIPCFAGALDSDQGMIVSTTSSDSSNKRRRFHHLPLDITMTTIRQDINTNHVNSASGKKDFRRHRPGSIDTSEEEDTYGKERIEVPQAPRYPSSQRSFFPSPRSVLDRRGSSAKSFWNT